MSSWMHRDRLGPVIVTLALAGCGAQAQVATEPPTATTTAAAPGSPNPTAAATAGPMPTFPMNVLDLPQASSMPGGRYFVEPEGLAIRVLYTVPPTGWTSWIGAYKTEQEEGRRHRFVELTIVNVTNVMQDACNAQVPMDPPIGPAVEDLVAAAMALEPFEVEAQPSDVEVAGYRGRHLALSVPPSVEFGVVGDESQVENCESTELRTWIGPPLEPAYYGYSETGQIEDLWILDVDGSRVLIATHRLPDSPDADVAELQAMFDSISIQRRPAP